MANNADPSCLCIPQSFNREWEDITRAQRSYSVPDPELREALKRDNKQALLPPYTQFHDAYATLPFSKNPDKYVKYTPVQVSDIYNWYYIRICNKIVYI